MKIKFYLFSVLFFMSADTALMDALAEEKIPDSDKSYLNIQKPPTYKFTVPHEPKFLIKNISPDYQKNKIYQPKPIYTPHTCEQFANFFLKREGMGQIGNPGTGKTSGTYATTVRGKLPKFEVHKVSPHPTDSSKMIPTSPFIHADGADDSWTLTYSSSSKRVDVSDSLIPTGDYQEKYRFKVLPSGACALQSVEITFTPIGKNYTDTRILNQNDCDTYILLNSTSKNEGPNNSIKNKLVGVPVLGALCDAIYPYFYPVDEKNEIYIKPENPLDSIPQSAPAKP